MQEPPKAPRREHHEEHQVKALEKHQELQEHPVPPVSQLARSQNAQGPHDTVERRHPLTAKETTTDKIMPVRRSIPPAIRNFWFARQRFRKSRDPTEEEIKYMEDLRLQDLQFFQKEIAYSPAYYDDTYEYRHVILPKEISRWLPSMDCLEESEWRELGVTKMTGWEHYMVHAPEPHILLFRRARQRREKPPPKEANENVAPPTEANEATNTTSS